MSSKKRKIAIFTGNRAEYGLQYPILQAVSRDPRLEYHLIVSGAHLKDDFGRTKQEIQKDGFRIHAEVKIDFPEDSLVATARSIGSCVVNLSNVLLDLKPDIMVVYADRFEGFGALITSTQMGIPTAHIEGGDYTEGGALDDSVRHAMTKLAHLHFTTNEQAAERVRKLGEEPWRVHNVGFPALDLVAAGHYAKPEEVYSRFALDSARPILIFTQHSVATESDQAADQLHPSLEALIECAQASRCQILVTYPNDDAGGRRIIEKLKALEARRIPSIQVHRNLGRYFYHGVLNVAAACLGNSSSGIKETPAFHCPCIDIGPRQRGRLCADNVIHVGYNKDEIVQAVRRCLDNAEFKKQVKNCVNPYGGGTAGAQIAEILATIEITPALIQKRMTY